MTDNRSTRSSTSVNRDQGAAPQILAISVGFPLRWSASAPRMRERPHMRTQGWRTSPNAGRVHRGRPPFTVTVRRITEAIGRGGGPFTRDLDRGSNSNYEGTQHEVTKVAILAHRLTFEGGTLPMRMPVVFALMLGCSFIVGCAKEEESPPPADPNSAYQQYPPPQQQYPQQTQPAPQQQYPAATPVATAPAAASPMATPGPLALPCQNDQACGTARCNVQYQKCAFPCVTSEVDCAQGNACNAATGLCLPGQ